MAIEAHGVMSSIVRHACRWGRHGLLFLVLLPAWLSGCGETSKTTAEPKPVGGPALLRQLTESQYRATIVDIFGADIPVAAHFGKPFREREDGLIAVGTSIAGMTPFAVEQYDNAAVGVADVVLSERRRGRFVSCKPASDSGFDKPCARHFVQRYGLLLFRRPLTAKQTDRFVDAAREGTSRLGDFYGGLKYALVGMMISPEFLLRVERTEPDPQHPGLRRLDAWSRATRLSFFLTNAAPDRELLRAAGAGELDTTEGLARQVDRLMATERFRQAMRAFFSDMLAFDQFADLTKDAEIYPAFNSQVAKDAQEQTLRTITYELIDRHGDYRDLFTTRDTFLTRALGIVYRLPVAKRHGWEKTRFPADSDREGIESHISFLALHAHPGRSSPTLRGKALREIFLCEEVPDPPPTVNFTAVKVSSKSMPTERERLTAHRTQPSCAGCHKIMDPVGLGFENFDGVGTLRTHENGALIDASGELDGTAFKNPKGLAQALHDHPETPRCLVEKMYRFAVGRDTVWGERSYMDYLIGRFLAEGYRVPDLMRTIALSKEFYAISPPATMAARAAD